jgi:hypothetical protein
VFFPGYKRDTNQNYTQILSHPSYNGHIQGQKQPQMLARIWCNRNLCTPLMGMQICANALESSMDIPQKARNTTAIRSSDTTSGHLPKGT